ncbi:hypothetical protein HDU91_003919 [Kappamyces sp. JEL0680]|nr:hypothetical protein HDU91_003919 [Kappamyces sp. JEL0680]
MKLMETRDLQQKLADAQLESLKLKQRQLELLEAKLAALEAMENDRESSLHASDGAKDEAKDEVKGGDLDPTVTAQASTTTLLDQDNHDFVASMMSHPVFRDKIGELQRQSQELAHLEAQLESLKDLKKKMKEKQDLVASVTREQVEELDREDQGEDVSTTHPALDAAIASGSGVESAAIPEPLETVSIKGSGLSELEAATEAMERYLDRQAELRLVGEPSSKDLATEAHDLEKLMERLMNASMLEDQDTGAAQLPATEPSDVSFAPEAPDVAKVDNAEDEDASDPSPVDDLEMDDTSAKIELAIQQITEQLDSIKSAKDMITTPEEQDYFDSVVGKLSSQLEELLEIKTKVTYYKELLELQKTVAAEVEANHQPEEAGEEIEESLEDSEEDAEEDADQDTPVIHGSAMAAEKSSFRGDEAAPAIIESQTTIEIETSDTISRPHVRVEKDSPQQRQSSAFPATERLSEYRPSLHQEVMAKFGANSPVPSTVASRKSTSARSKKLFAQHKDAIYQHASAFISAFENKPHFLLNLFKQLRQMADDDASQQQLLLMLDELIQEQNEDFDDEATSESVLLRSFANQSHYQESYDTAKGHLHVSIQSFVASLVLGTASEKHFTAEVLRDIFRHVNSLLYSELTSSTSRKVQDNDTALEIVDRFKPELDAIVASYSGVEIRGTWLKLVDQLNVFMLRVLDWLAESDPVIVVKA